MRRRTRTMYMVPLSLLCGALNAHAEPHTWTLAEALAHVRERAPAVLAARAGIDEARARLRGAALGGQQNPDVDIAFGPRSSGTIDLDLGLAQRFDAPGSRPARRAAAAAAVDQATALAEQRVRDRLRSVTLAFIDAAWRRERANVLNDAVATASELADVARRRFEAGDVAGLEVNVARASLARTQAEHQAALGDVRAALAGIEALLGVAPGEVRDIEAASLPDRDITAAVGSAAAQDRPDLRALTAAGREAAEEERLARSHRRPVWGPAVRYSRDEGDHILLGGLTVTLPAFNWGQEPEQAARARQTRIGLEVDALRAEIAAVLHGLVAAYEHRRAALDLVTREVLPALTDNERLALRSYDEGQMPLADVLVIRREVLDARLEAMARRRDVLATRVAIDFESGVLR